MIEQVMHHPTLEAYIDLYEQWLDEPCPAIRKELKAKMAAMEVQMRGETSGVQTTL